MIEVIELLNKIKNYIYYIFEQSNLGLSLLEIATIIFSLFCAILIRGFFAKLIVSKIKNLIQKTSNKIDDNLFESLSPPLRTLPFIIVFILIGMFVNSGSQFGILIENINQTLFTIFIFWFLHQALFPFSQVFKKYEELMSKTLFLWLTRSLKYLIIILGIVAVLETWGIKIGPVIAGLGLFGVAVALGAQDLFKNLISGIIIIFEKRFNLNDVIEVTGHATGTVEHIGFRSTLIRKFDSSSISIPNYVFSDTSILNYSDRKYRRINWIIGLTYDTSVIQLRDICQDIESYISSSGNFIMNDSYQLFVRVEKFNNSSIDILIYAFTNTNEWKSYLHIKEDLVFKIKHIVEKHNTSFAFPSHSIYIEKKDN